MTFEEFIEDFCDERAFVRVHNNVEKAKVVQILETFIDVEHPYIKPFDEEYPYVGWFDDHICGYNHALCKGGDMEYDEFMSIYRGDMFTEVDIQSLMELL